MSEQENNKVTKAENKSEEKVVEKVSEESSEKVVKAVKTDSKKGQYLYAVGRRKTSVAQVRVYKKGSGKITVNKQDYKKLYKNIIWQEKVLSPLTLVGQADKLDVTVVVKGGGITGQVEAIRHGIARALIQLNINFRKPLKKAGFLKRDARKKERKKPGLKRARRAPQWKKR